jgi:hypothetical protein
LVGIVRLRTKTTEFSFIIIIWDFKLAVTGTQGEAPELKSRTLFQIAEWLL